jgi:hypothetical protein
MSMKSSITQREQIGHCVITETAVLQDVTPSSLVDTGLLSPEN